MKPLFCAVGSEESDIHDAEIQNYVKAFLESLGPREDVLILPPDYTRYHSQAGKITKFIAEYYGFIGETKPSKSVPTIQIMPALGTHAPMSQSQIETMFGEELAKKEPSPFLVHDWRHDVATIGYAPAEMVQQATYGKVNEAWPAQLNKFVWEKRHHDVKKQANRTLVVSVGQVVPHEVMGMANFNKNLFVGVGGVEAINLSHFIGAVHGMEKMMGRASNPLRSILNYASEKFLHEQIDLWYILTVVGTDPDSEKLKMRGIYIGNSIECYNLACELSLKVNFTILDRAPKKIVAFLDQDEFHSTWLGNKAIYRTRMAIADGGELIVLAPGVRRFGEDDEVDVLIRKYGYVGTPSILKFMEENEELKNNLSAVAHLIHGSTEGRFSVTYCPGELTKEEVEQVGFRYADLKEMTSRYDMKSLKEGWNTETSPCGDDEEFYFISNPSLGLWAVPERFESAEDTDASRPGTGPTSLSTNQQAVDGSGGVGGWAKPP